ncbi:hypothetical protein NUU61_004505 [Penicillium alfredii]|uniref:Uncharacterized protein n=1 Tax=Penicillium alfredii TaxID=1506179 RepID=A0A9W9KE17_9EURO|nr:uncharacterized protein NUU61_004505 [Penicillium alfredii]KAJ5102283.1 hypothetical protein NUU61_004505 [Penicillium alfredii]
MESKSEVVDYTETLRQVSNSLENALRTFGADSHQYKSILSILEDCLRGIEIASQMQDQPAADADVLSAAMGFLIISE